jgi:hypothetical protein
VLVAAALVVACKEEAGPRPQAGAEDACAREPELSLSDFCDQSRDFRRLCERYESYDESLADSLQDCTETGFPLAVGDCDLRVIDRSHPQGGLRLYYDDGELVGVRQTTDQVFRCPKGFPREESVTTQVAGRVDEECEPCLLCGAVFGDDDIEVCGGEVGAPHVERCRDTFMFHDSCEPCACERCYPFTYSDLRDTAALFHMCVEDHCEACTVRPDAGPDGGEPEDAGEPDAASDAATGDEDAG